MIHPDVPVAGLLLASVYHAIGLLSLFVAVSFGLDAHRQLKARGDRVSSLPCRYIRGWIDWWKALPNDIAAAIGIIKVKPEVPHAYGAHYPLEVGIAHTALAWAGMAFYWAEKNISWMDSISGFELLLPLFWCWLYGRGYLMHLRTIWSRRRPYLWRLYMLTSGTYVLSATAIRVWLW